MMDKIARLEPLAGWQFDNHEFASEINWMRKVINMLLEKNGMLEKEEEESE